MVRGAHVVGHAADAAVVVTTFQVVRRAHFAMKLEAGRYERDFEPLRTDARPEAAAYRDRIATPPSVRKAASAALACASLSG